MHDVPKKLVTDESLRPIAVQIDYADWLRIEQALGLEASKYGPRDLSRHSGRLNWRVDGLQYQQQARSEWD